MKGVYKTSLLNSLGALVYISIVASIIENGDRIFGEMNDWAGPIAFLLLFTLSALVVGTLILGKPVMLYLDGKKKEAVSMLGSSVLWMASFTIIFLAILAVTR